MKEVKYAEFETILLIPVFAHIKSTVHVKHTLDDNTTCIQLHFFNPSCFFLNWNNLVCLVKWKKTKSPKFEDSYITSWLAGAQEKQKKKKKKRISGEKAKGRTSGWKSKFTARQV